MNILVKSMHNNLVIEATGGCVWALVGCGPLELSSPFPPIRRRSPNTLALANEGEVKSVLVTSLRGCVIMFLLKFQVSSLFVTYSVIQV